jgi:hypothetical protein
MQWNPLLQVSARRLRQERGVPNGALALAHNVLPSNKKALIRWTANKNCATAKKQTYAHVSAQTVLFFFFFFCAYMQKSKHVLVETCTRTMSPSGPVCATTANKATVDCQ